MSETSRQTPLLSESDKSFWHGYVPFYDRVFPSAISAPIVEFGVFHGHSIRWLMSKYPDVRIYGVDILKQQPEWPISERVEYRCVDQSDERAVANFFQSIEAPGLIIEDGSHLPSHQARCLRLGLRSLISGGVYVLEDIHSSHPMHELYAEEFGQKSVAHGAKQHPTVLSLLLCFEHLLRLGRHLRESEIRQFSHPGFMNEEELRALFDRVKRIEVFKRSTLPTRCYACNSSKFIYTDFVCECGVNLMKEADSMTVFIEVN